MLVFKKYFLLSEKIEKTDIIDLYILMALSSPGTSGGTSIWAAHEDDAYYNFIVDEIKSKAKANITSEIEGILLRELRHLNDRIFWGGWDLKELVEGDKSDIKEYINFIKSEPDSLERKAIQHAMQAIFGSRDAMPIEKFIKGMVKTLKFLDKKYGEEGSNKYLKTEITLADLWNASDLPWTIDAVESAFENLNWEGAYGGNNWARIAREAKDLLNAGASELFSKIDRFIDFVHNSGPVIDKFKGYKEGWLKFILDLKAQALNIRELIPFASRDVQKLFKSQMWRSQMAKLPGPGAQETDEALRLVLLKTLPRLIHDINEDGPYFYNADMVNLLKQYPWHRIQKALDPNDPQMSKLLKQVVQAAIDQIGALEWEEVFKEAGELPKRFSLHLRRFFY